MKTFNRIKTANTFSPPKNWQAIHTIDMHTGGEPLRVITGGFPDLEGNSVLDYRRYCLTHHDELRTALMWEPRGHADMYGCILVPPNDNDGDFGVLFIHNEGYSTMCGHAVIALGKLAVEMGWVKGEEPLTTIFIDAPCGRIKVMVRISEGKVEDVTFHCVPSFVLGLDLQVEVPGLGNITYDLAYGGAFYAYVDIAQLDLTIKRAQYRRYIELGMAIKHAVMAAQPPVHPFEEDLSFLYGTIFTEAVQGVAGLDSRNVCIFADGEVDRCPTGSGVSGRMAIHHARGELGVGESMTIESIVGSRFVGSVVEPISFGPHAAVIPAVTGTAHITGQHTFYLDPDDLIGKGFFLR